MDLQPLGTVAFTITAGIFALILGSRTRFPSIIFLLFFGIFLGPHFANVVQPAIFREEFPDYISMLVALILFEGGASLKFSQFHDISKTLRRLLSGGLAVTLLLVSLAAHLIAGFTLEKAVLFGAIMVVSGPTVVLPILQRIRAKQNLHNILKWEAILIDPLGVVTAVVLFELLLSGHFDVWHGLASFAAKILAGSVLGLFAGWLMYVGLTKKWLLRFEGEELGGLFVLACNLLFYALAEWWLPESGLVVATVAGIYLGNKKFALQDQIFHFKKQLTLLALSALFILLSSNVPVGQIQSIWGQGTALLLILIFVVRPAAVFLSTWGDTSLSVREKWFLSLIAPRGIVSASLASLFAIAFEEKALSSGTFLPLAFYVISGSILFYALFAGVIARALGVHEAEGKTTVIIGANRLGLIYGEELRKRGMPVVFIDTNPYLCFAAREKKFEAYTGSAFDREFLESLDLKGICRAAALTPNNEANVLICQSFSRYLGKNKVFRLWDKTDTWENVTSASYDESRGRPLIAASCCHLPQIWAWLDSETTAVKAEKIDKEITVDAKCLSAWQDSFPLFAVSGGKISFLLPKAVVPKDSEILFIRKTPE